VVTAGRQLQSMGYDDAPVEASPSVQQALSCGDLVLQKINDADAILRQRRVTELADFFA
jgi:hypothetical protein